MAEYRVVILEGHTCDAYVGSRRVGAGLDDPDEAFQVLKRNGGKRGESVIMVAEDGYRSRVRLP